MPPMICLSYFTALYTYLLTYFPPSLQSYPGRIYLPIQLYEQGTEQNTTVEKSECIKTEVEGEAGPDWGSPIAVSSLVSFLFRPIENRKKMLITPSYPLYSGWIISAFSCKTKEAIGKQSKDNDK